MANRHFGKIGDIWKHLPLAETLSIERPSRYWESHAGSARYPLTHSPDRDYGVYHFFDHSSNHAALRKSAFADVLARMAISDELSDYPGSPLIAMTVLNKQPVRYLFADIDTESLTTIRAAGQQLNVEEDRLVVIEGDGVMAVEQAAEKLSADEMRSTFVHLDPYRPFLRSTSGVNCIQLFALLTARGVRTMLWYGFDSDEYRDLLLASAREAVASQHSSGNATRLWCGEIRLALFDHPTFDYVPGVLTCGILCGNLSDESEATCDRLGQALVGIYEGTLLPNNSSGAVRFISKRIEN